MKFFFSNNSKLYLDMAMRFWEEQTPDTQLRESLPWNICQMIHYSSFVASSLKLSLMSYWKKEKQRTHGPMLTHTVACFFRYSYTLLVQFCGYMYLIAQIWCDSISEGYCFAFLIGNMKKRHSISWFSTSFYFSKDWALYHTRDANLPFHHHEGTDNLQIKSWILWQTFVMQTITVVNKNVFIRVVLLLNTTDWGDVATLL